MTKSETVAKDRKEIVLRRWYERTRDAIRPLITSRLIVEHKRDPLGEHSDSLKRVLNLLRRTAPNGKYVLVCTQPFKQWRIARVSGLYGRGPVFVDGRRFNTEAKAMHAVFLLRIDELTR
jgi:branched-chain amino acid transport system permease protein